VVTLQESTKKLRDAESLVAQLTGQLKALEAQEQEYTERLAQLGLTPDQVPQALQALQDEERRLDAEIGQLTEVLVGALG
jgi:chromosome segregation ATPase